MAAEKVVETEEITALDVGILVYREEAIQFPDFPLGRRSDPVGIWRRPIFLFRAPEQERTCPASNLFLAY